MAERTLTTLTVNLLLVGMLIMGLVGFYVLLVNNEGRGELFDEYPEVEAYNLEVQSTFANETLLETSNVNANISSEYNTEISQSGGDRSGNAIGTNLRNIISTSWATFGFLGYILFGNIYTSIISGLIVSILGYFITAYFIKAIRMGQT